MSFVFVPSTSWKRGTMRRRFEAAVDQTVIGVEFSAALRYKWSGPV